MTKKKPKTKTKPKDPAAGTETLDLSLAKVYERQLRQKVDDWAKKALQLLVEDIRALETPEGAREIRPRTSDLALLRRLESIGGDAVNGWIVLPARPPAPRMPETLKADPNRLGQGWLLRLRGATHWLIFLAAS